jgi:DNA-binding LytR/AlgR family response regulator
VDFLLKPIEYPRFLKSIQRAQKRLNEAAEVAYSVKEDAVFVRHNSKYVKVPLETILWIEAVGDYANIHTDTRRYTIHTTMKTLEAKLPISQFMRVHRSYIVRIDCIQEIEDNSIAIGRDKVLPLGKSYRSKLLQTLNLI